MISRNFSQAQIIHCVSTHKIRIKLGGDQTKSSHVESPGFFKPPAESAEKCHPIHLGSFFWWVSSFLYPLCGICMDILVSWRVSCSFIFQSFSVVHLQPDHDTHTSPPNRLAWKHGSPVAPMLSPRPSPAATWLDTGGTSFRTFYGWIMMNPPNLR